MNYLPPFHTSKSLGRIAEEDELIFETPQDLLCPITHDIFKDPVLNVAGRFSMHGSFSAPPRRQLVGSCNAQCAVWRQIILCVHRRRMTLRKHYKRCFMRERTARQPCMTINLRRPPASHRRCHGYSRDVPRAHMFFTLLSLARECHKCSIS